MLSDDNSVEVQIYVEVTELIPGKRKVLLYTPYLFDNRTHLELCIKEHLKDNIQRLSRGTTSQMACLTFDNSLQLKISEDDSESDYL